MYGISGAFAFAQTRQFDPAIIERLSESQRHRDIDGECFWFAGEHRLTFAHRLLGWASKAHHLFSNATTRQAA